VSNATAPPERAAGSQDALHVDIPAGASGGLEGGCSASASAPQGAAGTASTQHQQRVCYRSGSILVRSTRYVALGCPCPVLPHTPRTRLAHVSSDWSVVVRSCRGEGMGACGSLLRPLWRQPLPPPQPHQACAAAWCGRRVACCRACGRWAWSAWRPSSKNGGLANEKSQQGLAVRT
jgi:hypothetical protein